MSYFVNLVKRDIIGLGEIVLWNALKVISKITQKKNASNVGKDVLHVHLPETVINAMINLTTIF